MTLSHEVRGLALVCRPEGDLDESAEARIAELAAAPEASGARAVVLDMGGTTYISSRGVASLLRLQSDLTAPSPLVRRILFQAGVVAAMSIYFTVEEACSKA